MTFDEEDIEQWSRAARPTLFDCLAEPRLIIALVLANLMSPALWNFRDRLKQKIDSIGKEQAEDPTQLMLAEVGRYVDRHLYHVPPSEMGDIWGFVSLESERRRVGQDVVDYAVADILANLRKREELGSFTASLDIFPVVNDGRFPEYEYAAVDVILAYRRILKKKKHRPLGITCCVDEATLIASLATVLHTASLEDLVFVGAPVHLTTFITHREKAYWFNGKHEFFDQAAWQAELAKDSSSSDPQKRLDNALDKRVVVERFVTPQGWHLLRSDHSTLDETAEARIFSALAKFFGGEPQLIKEARSRAVRHLPSSDQPLSFDALAEVKDAKEARQVMGQLAAVHPGSVFEAALYCHRDLNVARPEAYFKAAQRGPKLRAAAAAVGSLEEALDLLRGIESRESIFADRERIALPDEVLLFRTANDRERALLLAALLAEAPALKSNGPWEILFTEDQSFIRRSEDCFDADKLIKVPFPDAPLVLRIGSEA